MVLLCVGLALAASWEPSSSRVSLKVSQHGCRYGECRTTPGFWTSTTSCSRAGLACGETRETRGGVVIQCGCTPPVTGCTVGQSDVLRFVACGMRTTLQRDSVACHCR